MSSPSREIEELDSSVSSSRLSSFFQSRTKSFACHRSFHNPHSLIKPTTDHLDLPSLLLGNDDANVPDHLVSDSSERVDSVGGDGRADPGRGRSDLGSVGGLLRERGGRERRERRDEPSLKINDANSSVVRCYSHSGTIGEPSHSRGGKLIACWWEEPKKERGRVRFVVERNETKEERDSHAPVQSVNFLSPSRKEYRKILERFPEAWFPVRRAMCFPPGWRARDLLRRERVRRVERRVRDEGGSLRIRWGARKGA